MPTDETPNLKLPYIMPAQAQKHVTHNEAIRALDALVQIAVADRDLAAPPVSPAEGVRYIVAASATGAWSGQSGKIAAFQDGAWAVYAPAEGWIAWVADENTLVVWDGSAWIAAGGGSTSLNPTPLVGINATADATNRLAVAAAASLFNHDGAGHQQKINKAAAGNTASTLYQDGFSGRAEIGLTGDDDFHFKVSPDGSTFREAMIVNRSTGAVAHLAGARHTFGHDATNAGLNVVPAAGDPSSPQNGDIWYNSTTGKLRKREGGVTSDLDTGGSFTPFSLRCSAKVTATVNVPHNTLTDIPLDVESYDAGGWHSTSSNTQRMTVPSGVAMVLLWGYVQFTATLSGNYYFEIDHFNSGGTQLATFPYALALSAVGGEATTGPIAVSAGDYFIMRAYQASGSTKTLWADGRCYLAIAAIA